MSDELESYHRAVDLFTSHDSVNHSKKEFARGQAYNNTAESFNVNVERAKLVVFHYLSKKHVVRYLYEICFRWNHGIPELKKDIKGSLKIVMKPMPAMMMSRSLLENTFMPGTPNQIRWRPKFE